VLKFIIFLRISFRLDECYALARKRRPHHTHFVSFHEKEVPTRPNSSAFQILQDKRVSPATINQIKTVWNSDDIFSVFGGIYFHLYLEGRSLERILPPLILTFQNLITSSPVAKGLTDSGTQLLTLTHLNGT